MSTYRLLVAVVLTLAVSVNAEDAEKTLPFPLSPLSPFAPRYESVKNTECRKQSLTFLKELQELKFWAVQMYDASGKISSGVTRGNVNWLGDNKECLAVSSNPHAAAEDPENIRGQHCTFRIFAEPRNTDSRNIGDLLEIFDNIHTHNIMQNSIGDRITFFPSFTPLSIGLCIPRSCTEEDLEVAVTEWLSPFNSTVDIQVFIKSGDCQKEEIRPKHFGVYFTLGLSLTMTLIGVAGAIYECRKENKIRMGKKVEQEGKLARIFLAFSFRSNTKTLLDTKTPNDDIGCLNGIRTGYSILLYLLHKGILSLHGSISNRSEVSYLLTGPRSMILRAFWNHVDAFVVMSGLLTSYFSIKKLQQGGKLNIPKMYLRRYIKFTPLYLVCVLFGANIIREAVSDTEYTRIVHQFSSSCEEGWMSIITYTNTFRGLDNMCYQPAHQLETDMHMYLISPFIILMLWKLRKTSILPMLFIITSLSALKYYQISAHNLGSILFYGVGLEHMVRSANIIYLNAVNRLVPYISGIILGYILGVRKEDNKLSKFHVIISGALAMLAAYYSFFGMTKVSFPGYVFEVKEHAIFGVLQPLLWSYSICWFIFMCENGQAEFINKPLKWRGFLVTSRLAYAFYLVQIPVMLMEVARTTSPVEFSIYTFLDLNVFFICVAASVWLTLLFLIPIGALWNIFTESAKTETTKQKIK